MRTHKCGTCRLVFEYGRWSVFLLWLFRQPPESICPSRLCRGQRGE